MACGCLEVSFDLSRDDWQLAMIARTQEDRYTLDVYEKVRLPIQLSKGEGNYVFDDAGNRYLDLYGGHALASLGHCHPGWVEDMRRQIGRLVCCSNAVYHELRGQAGETLVRNSYPSMHAVYFCGSGAEANETALKIARKATGRRRIVSMIGGFHGRTLGALSVTGFESLRHAFPENVAHHTSFVPFGDLEAIQAMEDDVAAVIVEPIQSVAGVFVASKDYYTGLRRHCTRKGICLIFDEVQTGTGRTGHWFAGHHWGVEPDLVTTAKGVAAGFPAGVVIANERYSAAVEAGDHATTFGGGPLAAAAILSTYRIIEAEGLVDRVAGFYPIVRRRLQGLFGRGVSQIRGLGYLLGVELERPAKEIQRALLGFGVLVGTCGQPQTIRLLPPLTVDIEDWDVFFSALERVLGLER